jgi:DNA-binding transcriptional LysR family regulator
LTRTTRSVSPTEAGERLLHNIAPRFEEIEAELAALRELREKPAGTIRLTAGDHAIRSVIWPKLAKFLPKYPEIKVEMAIDYGLTDIVAQRYDAGVRWGEQVGKDMLRGAVLSGCSKNGVRLGQATTSIIRAAGNLHQPSLWL